MAGEIDINTVAKAYARWAPVYDFVFGAVFDAGRKATIAAAERIGGRSPPPGVRPRLSLPPPPPAPPGRGGGFCPAQLRQADRAAAAPRRPPGPRPAGVGGT